MVSRTATNLVRLKEPSSVDDRLTLGRTVVKSPEIAAEKRREDAPMDARSGSEDLPMLHFGGFTLDRARRGLYRGGERVRLTPKPLETLIVLVENRGHAVDKATLLQAVWGETVVTEDVLVQAVGDIRRALGDDKDDPRFVLTVPREGYRFVASVEAEALAASPPSPSGLDVLRV